MGKRMYVAGASALAVCIAVLGVLAWQHFTRPHIDVAKYIDPAPRTELMDEATAEWMEIHFPSLNGVANKDDRTKVVYRDGNVGWRIYRPDNTLGELVVHSKKGEELVHLWYSPRGTMVVTGFEKRNNGTLRRDVRLEGDMVTTRTFWQDGKTLFALDRRKVDDYNRDIAYFHENGAKWSAWKGSVYATVPPSESQWDDQERPVRFYEFDDEKTHTGIAKFYADGVLRYVQNYLPWTHDEYEEHGGKYEVTQRALKTIDEYDVNHRLVRRITMVDGGKLVESVDVFDPETAAVVAHVAFDKEGKGPLQLPPELISTDLKVADPTVQWKAAEKKISLMDEAK